MKIWTGENLEENLHACQLSVRRFADVGMLVKRYITSTLGV